MSQLHGSTGVERDHEPVSSACPVLYAVGVTYVRVLSPQDAKDIDVDAEPQKWKAGIGEAVALRLRELVDAEMPNYEYLRKHISSLVDSPLASNIRGRKHRLLNVF